MKRVESEDQTFDEEGEDIRIPNSSSNITIKNARDVKIGYQSKNIVVRNARNVRIANRCEIITVENARNVVIGNRSEDIVVRNAKNVDIANRCKEISINSDLDVLCLSHSITGIVQDVNNLYGGGDERNDITRGNIGTLKKRKIGNVPDELEETRRL